MMTYFHPRDFDVNQPVIETLPAMRRFKSYVGIKGAFTKFQRLLDHYEFYNVEQADEIMNWEIAPIVALKSLKQIYEKVALLTGITGQDGSFLAEFLIEKGYEVHGILRRSSSFNTGRIEHLYLDEWVRDMKQQRLVNLHYGDMTDSSSLIRIIQQVQPDEIYNLAAQSHVKVSFDVPEYTAEADAVGTLRMLEAVRILGLEKKTKIYQASTSELYGKVQEVPQKETTPFYPRSPYGVAKQYGFG